MDISQFQNQTFQGDLARNNLYAVEFFHPPLAEQKFYNNAEAQKMENMSYKVKQVTLPGKSLGTIDARRFGPVFKVANDMIVDTVAMTLMLSPDYREHQYFEGWISAVAGYDKAVTEEKRQRYTLSYYTSYISKVMIIPLDRNFESVAPVVILEEAYPTNVGPVELSWGSDGQIAECNVTWSFRDWHYGPPAGKEWNGYVKQKDLTINQATVT